MARGVAVVVDGGEVGDGVGDISDDELCALALAADLDVGVAPDAVEMGTFLGQVDLLPVWYMPGPMARVSPGWRRVVVLVVVGAFVAIEAAGLCSTFGQVVPA